MSCVTILFLTLQITRSDIRPHIKWAVSLVVANGHFSFPQAASNVSASLNQKSWTLYKMYWRLANGILMGTLRSESRGVYDYGGSNEWFI